MSTEYIPHIDPTIITDETVCRVRSHIVIFFIASVFFIVTLTKIVGDTAGSDDITDQGDMTVR